MEWYALTRAVILGNLTKLNRLVNDIDISSRDSINTVLNDFTTVFRDVTDPLFKKDYTYKDTSKF